MADVNINQTYRINIETNEGADKTVELLKKFKGTLSELEKLSGIKGIDKTVDSIISGLGRLKSVASGFDKKVKGCNYRRFEKLDSSTIWEKMREENIDNGMDK